MTWDAMTKPLRLTLFMTSGVSLQVWERAGMFEREVALYRKLAERGAEIGFVTYGGPGELAFSGRLPGMRILCNRWRLPGHWYERLIPLLHGGWLRRSHVVKSNQVLGAETALRAAGRWRKPLAVRCGYLPSDFFAHMEGADSDAARAAFDMENRIFNAAARIIVTAQAMADDLAGRIRDPQNKTAVIPNYVDTGLFQPAGDVEKDTDVLFIGRLAEQKNIQALLQALAPLDITATIVGAGPLRDVVDQARSQSGGRLRWVEQVNGSELPNFMNKARVFVLPSLWEGHPKTLIEAMASGMPVIGGDSPGIRGVIDHGVNGWLCATDAEGIGGAVMHLLAHPDLCRQLGANARSHAEAVFSLDKIVEKEWPLLKELAGQ